MGYVLYTSHPSMRESQDRFERDALNRAGKNKLRSIADNLLHNAGARPHITHNYMKLLITRLDDVGLIGRKEKLVAAYARHIMGIEKP